MKIHNYIAFFVLGGLLLFSPALAAKQTASRSNPESLKKDRVVWTKKPNSRTGLYTTKNYFVSHGVSLGVNAMYYFGDVDNEGVAFHGGFNENNLSYGGSLVFGYTMPAGNHCNIRYSLMGGTLRGNNKAKFDALPDPRDDYRKFNSILILPSVGVEYYPFSNAGFYIYGGLAVAVSIITNYEFYAYRKVDASGIRQRTKLEGKTFGILPMVQVGIGYSWRLTQSWTMSAEIMLNEGLIDTHYMNLDAFPLAGSQSSDGQPLGNSFGKWTDKNGNEHIHWNDGWFQVGITVSYRWRNCESCRILNNYSNIRARRR
ncbi:MAG: hypothetical protein II901_00295 [Paludibacteraceae bacterium]|nr:hypothetical protein [Paludibacteraceae bacterium]